MWCEPSYASNYAPASPPAPLAFPIGLCGNLDLFASLVQIALVVAEACCRAWPNSIIDLPLKSVYDKFLLLTYYPWCCFQSLYAAFNYPSVAGAFVRPSYRAAVDSKLASRSPRPAKPAFGAEQGPDRTSSEPAWQYRLVGQQDPFQPHVCRSPQKDYLALAASCPVEPVIARNSAA